MSKRTIEIAGQRYKVLDTLGYQHSAGHYAKEVETENGPRMAVSLSRSGPWRWWGVSDRVAPLLAALLRARSEEPKP